MEYFLECRCGEKLPVVASQAGQILTCPCGESVQIPTLRQLRELPRTTPSDETNSQSGLAPKSWSTARGFIFVTGVVTAIVASGFLVKFFLDSSKLDVKRPSMDVFQGQPSAAGMTAEETWEVWKQAREMSFENRPTPLYLFHREIAQKIRLLMAVAGTALAAGLGMIVSSLWQARRATP